MREGTVARTGFQAIIAFMLLTTVFIGIACADTVFVQGKTAKLRAGKTSLDPVVTDVKFGEALEVLRKDGNWLEVQTTAGKTGWIFLSKTTPTKPAGADDNSLARLGQNFRAKEASDVTASAGARGLDKTSEVYANKAGITQQHRDAVDRMTAYRITDQDVEDFLKNGALGEYAK